MDSFLRYLGRVVSCGSSASKLSNFQVGRLQQKYTFFHRIREYIANRMLQIASFDETKLKGLYAFDIEIDVPGKPSGVEVHARASFPAIRSWANRMSEGYDDQSPISVLNKKQLDLEIAVTDGKKDLVVLPIPVMVGLKSPADYMDETLTLTPPFDVNIQSDLARAGTTAGLQAEAMMEAIGVAPAIRQNVHDMDWSSYQFLAMTPEEISEVLEQEFLAKAKNAGTLPSPKLAADAATAKQLLEDAKPEELKSLVLLLHAEDRLADSDTLTAAGKAVDKYLKGLYPGDPSFNLDSYHVKDAKTQPIANLVDGVSTGALSPRLTQVERPVPPSMFIQTYGSLHFARTAVFADRSVSRMLGSEDVASYLDVRQYLNEEIQRAYDWLSQPGQGMWEQFCTQRLAQAVRLRDFVTINQIHREFDEVASARTNRTITVALAWSILVDAALLNERLIDDMKRVSREKGCTCLYGDGLSFVGPEEVISPEAQSAFKEYVNCRWPIQVFALDPVAEDQNISDQFSRRRELQLAIAAGVARGTVTANAAARFARRLETDIQTISLNRTQIAFSHGSDTFGWRFYPRLQTPDTPGTLGAFGQTLLGGPDQDADLRDRGIEPGLRECTAVIVMPSFVPHVTIESRGSWFGLTNPRKKALTMQDAMKISRNFQAVRRGLQSAHESCAYRPGDVAHMTHVVDQMERRLPMQHMLTPIPFENTLGGFEMFSTGVTDLAPELYGWYGAPGVLVKSDDKSCTDTGVDLSGNQCSGTCKGTTVFLVGNRFSVHDTKVIAGGKCVPFTLVSREIMRATIPYDVGTVSHTLSDKKTKQSYVDVHVATPYGVTSHLLLKAVEPKEKKKEEELEKTVAAIQESVEKITRDVIPTQAATSPNSAKVELVAQVVKTGGMKVTPGFGAKDIDLEFTNQTGQPLYGDVHIALLQKGSYITPRIETGAEIKQKKPSKGKTRLEIEKLANNIDKMIGSELKSSAFKDKKISLVGVLFVVPDGDDARTIRVLGEIPVEITHVEGELVNNDRAAYRVPIEVAALPQSSSSMEVTFR